MPISSLAPVELLRRADPSVQTLKLDKLYSDHFDFVYRLARRLGGPTLESEDIAQDVFLVVERKLSSYDGSSKVTTWLYGITLNVVRAHRRRFRLRNLFDRTSELKGVDAAFPSLDAVEVVEAHRIAFEILEKLTAKKREVFILAEFEGLDSEEIGTIVGAPAETVWSRLHYARREFAEHLARRKL